MHAYLQRLGGHIDEARRTVFELRDGAMSRAVSDDGSRERLLDSFSTRLADLEASREAILTAYPLWRAVIMVRQADRDIAAATAEAFTPAMPLDPKSLIYAAIGLVIGWMIWELVQWPVKARLRARRQRRLLR